MSEKKEIFADGIGQIHFAGGMVRYDFVTLQPESEGQAPVPQSNVRKLLEAGVLQKNENAGKKK